MADNKESLESDLVGEAEATELDDEVSPTDQDDQSSDVELDDDFSGSELDDEFSGDELNDSFSGAELDDDFSGAELDEKAPDQSSLDKADNTKKRPKPVSKGFSARKLLWPLLLVCLSLLALGGWYFFKNYSSPEPKTTKVARFKIKPGKIDPKPVTKKAKSSFAQIKPTILTLEPFIVPVKPDKETTYVAMNISLSLSTRELIEEIKTKRVTLRGIIYGILQKQVGKSSTQPTSDDMERGIARAVNRHLSIGKIKSVSVDNWRPT